MSTPSYTDIDNWLQHETGRIKDMVASKTVNCDVWNKLVTQETFPTGMGASLTTLIRERTVVPNVGTSAWTDLGLNDGTGNTCAPTPQDISFAATTKSWNLQVATFRGPVLCIDDIYTAWDFSKQLADQYKLLTDNSKYFWSNRFRDEFDRLSGNKIIVDTTDYNTMTRSGSDAAWAASRPRYALDQGILDNIYLELMRDSADGHYAMVDGAAQYLLICSPETSNYLKKQNADIREDLRYSTEVDELIKPFGVKFAYSGFLHWIDYQAPRYDFVNGALVRRPYYSTTAATQGNKAIVNPAYKTAAYEVSYVYNTNVLTSYVPPSVTSPGGNTSFDPQLNRGEIRWINNKGPTENIEGNQGFFFAKLINGSEPKRVEWGYAILHNRCAPATLYQTCS